jgi:hypothetical protein
MRYFLLRAASGNCFFLLKKKFARGLPEIENLRPDVFDAKHGTGRLAAVLKIA